MQVLAKFKKALIVSFILAWPTGAHALNTESGFDFGHYHALVIGNEDYQHLEKLKTAVDDAEAVASLLSRDYGFTVKTLRNAERDDIIEELDRLRATLSEKDNLLIYYAGHGVFDPGADRGYWLPVDAQGETRSRWISNTTIADTLKAMRAKHVLVVADSCYSGTLTRDIGVRLKTGEDPAAYQLKMARKRSRTALTSGGLEPVLDSGGSGHSIFAKTFLAVLRENMGVLEGQSVFEKIRRPIQLNAEQQPKYSDIRFTGHEDGDFLFWRKTSTPGTVAEFPDPVTSGSEVNSEEMARMQAQLHALQNQPQEMTPLQPALPPVVAKAPTYSAPQQHPREITGQDGAPLVLIPAGEFLMGNDGGFDDHQPKHRVYLDSFYMDKYEVTTSRYGKFLQRTGRDKPKYWDELEMERDGEKPVLGVTWTDAEAYCTEYGKRLPTEAEWEKAARGTDGRTFPWGEYNPQIKAGANPYDIWCFSFGGLVDQYCNRYENLMPVGAHEKGKSPYGVYDMGGNVMEWVADWYDETYYQSRPQSNPKGPSGGVSKVFRGGVRFGIPTVAPVCIRTEDVPSTRYVDLGFRCAQDAP